MSENKQDNPLNGLILIGSVNAKTTRVFKNGDEHFYLSIAPPGYESMLKVEVKPQEWGAYQIGSQFKAKVEVSNIWNNQVTFSPLVQ